MVLQSLNNFPLLFIKHIKQLKIPVCEDARGAEFLVSDDLVQVLAYDIFQTVIRHVRRSHISLFKLKKITIFFWEQ